MSGQIIGAQPLAFALRYNTELEALREELGAEREAAETAQQLLREEQDKGVTHSLPPREEFLARRHGQGAYGWVMVGMGEVRW